MAETHGASSGLSDKRLQRREMADDSIHSLEMAGLTVSDWQLANIDKHVAGTIELDELISSALRHHSADN